MLDGKSDTEAQEITEGYMRMADATAHAQGEGVAFEAFCRLYETLVLAQARQQLRFKLGLQAEGVCAVLACHTVAVVRVALVLLHAACKPHACKHPGDFCRLCVHHCSARLMRAPSP
jgi:hypothetical protein